MNLALLDLSHITSSPITGGKGFPKNNATESLKVSSDKSIPFIIVVILVPFSPLY